MKFILLLLINKLPKTIYVTPKITASFIFSELKNDISLVEILHTGSTPNG